MKVAFVKDGKILSISNSTVKPNGGGWIVLSDSFNGKVGDSVSETGAVVYESQAMSPDEAIALVKNAEKELAESDAAFKKAKETFETAEGAMKAAVVQATDATNARNAAYAALMETERKYKNANFALLQKKDTAKRVIDSAVEKAADEAANQAKEETRKKVRKTLESGKKESVKKEEV